MNGNSLNTLPPGVAEATQLVTGLDECLLIGFARLGSAQHESLENLVGAFAGTPLEAVLREASAAVRRSEFLVPHFRAFAGARTAIQGAQYDALLKQADAALGRETPVVESAQPVTPTGPHSAMLSSTQHWLMELALAGFKHLASETLTPFSATLDQLQAESQLTRLAVLLTGFLGELLEAQPADGGALPVFRWADLWTRAMILAQAPPGQETGQTISGTFYPIGVDVRSHAHFASLIVYGVLDTDGNSRTVRMHLSNYKVDVITQLEIWQLFRPAADPLLESLQNRKALRLTGMQLLAGGDLLWTGKAEKTGQAYDPLETAQRAVSEGCTGLAAQPPLARHPVQLAELAYLGGISIRSSNSPDKLEVVGEAFTLPIAHNRMATGTEFDTSAIKQAVELAGLLRFDGGNWAIQPLALRSKAGKKLETMVAGESALEFCKKDKTKTLAILSERAGKLLRQL